MKKYSDFKSFSKDQAYWERNQLVSALSKVYPSWMELHPLSDEKWDKDWRHTVFIIIPSRSDRPSEWFDRVDCDQQLSWHIHDSDVPYFKHLELKGGNSWDGHTTDQKYWRLSKLRLKNWWEFWKQ